MTTRYENNSSSEQICGTVDSLSMEASHTVYQAESSPLRRDEHAIINNKVSKQRPL